MERLNYTARPQSDLYPGQYKVLRRVDTNKRLDIGNRYFGTFIIGSVIVYGVFSIVGMMVEKMFSVILSSSIKIKRKLMGGLNEQEYDDLYHPRDSGIVVRNVRDAQYIPEDIRKTSETNYNLNRPSERHVLEAQRIQQEQEEKC